MHLSLEQIKSIVDSPKNSSLINQVKRQESKLRVFTEELEQDELEKEPYWSEFLAKMKKTSEKKFDRICDFITYPLPIVLDNDAIINDFFKVFEGKNRYFNVTADRDLTRLNDWIRSTNVQEWIEENIRDVWLKKPCSFVVLDVDNKNPYLINVDSSRLIDADFSNKSGQLNYIAFVHSMRKNEQNPSVIETRIAVYDSEKYVVVVKRSDSDVLEIDRNVTHSIGYCPAHSFITNTTNDNNLFKRRVAFSKAGSKMEVYTTFNIYNHFLDHYAPFPVTESPMKKCSNQDCQNGRVGEQVIIDAATNQTETRYHDCSTCDGGRNQGKLIGPGTHIGIKVKNDGKDGSGIFRMIFPDTKNMQYIPTKLDKILLNIKNNIVGVNGMISKEAVNELQAKGGFESMESVIMRNKKNLDFLYKWIVRTSAKLMYKNIEPRIDANFGTEWYLSTEEDIQKKFSTAKKIGLPLEEIKMIYLQLIETKYKGDEDKIARQRMLLDLDPMPIYSIEECIKFKSESVIDDYQLLSKVNFMNYIQKFERENTSITQFGVLLDYSERINIVKKVLDLYNENNIKIRSLRANPEDADDSKPISQEQLDAQARLKGTVGGVQGILGIQQGLQSKQMSYSAAIATLRLIYGFDEEDAKAVLGKELKNLV